MSDIPWRGPFVKVHRLIQEEDWYQNDRALAKYVRELVRVDKERRRKRRFYVSPRIWAEIVRRFGGRCAYCGASGVPLQKEHRFPLAKGGLDDPSNLVPACGPCNRHKFTSIWPLLIEPLP